MFFKRFALNCLGLLLVSGVALADDDDYSSGAYVGGALSIGVEQFDFAPGSVDFKEAFGVDLWAGYRVHRYIGIEGQFVYLKGFDIKGAPIDFNALNFTANVKVYPISGTIQPYLLGGIGGGRFEIEGGGESVDDSGGVFRLGGGVDVYVFDSVALVAGIGYLFTRGDITDTDILEIRLGVQYQF